MTDITQDLDALIARCNRLVATTTGEPNCVPLDCPIQGPLRPPGTFPTYRDVANMATALEAAKGLYCEMKSGDAMTQYEAVAAFEAVFRKGAEG